MCHSRWAVLWHIFWGTAWWNNIPSDDSQESNNWLHECGYLSKRELATTDVTPTHSTMLQPVWKVERLGHKLKTDNYFSFPPPLFDDQYKSKINCYGIFHHNTSNFPQKDLDMKKGNILFWIWRNLRVVCWKDKEVCPISRRKLQRWIWWWWYQRFSIDILWNPKCLSYPNHILKFRYWLCLTCAIWLKFSGMCHSNKDNDHLHYTVKMKNTRGFTHNYSEIYMSPIIRTSMYERRHIFIYFFLPLNSLSLLKKKTKYQQTFHNTYLPFLAQRASSVHHSQSLLLTQLSQVM